jgi:MFS family permease
MKEGMAFLLQRWKFYLPFLATLSITSIVNYNFFAWTPTLLQRGFGFSLPESGLIFGTILLVSGPIGMVVAATFIDRARKTRREVMALLVCTVATVLAIPFILMATLSKSFEIATIGFAGVIFLIAVIVPLGPFVAQATAPNEFRGFAASVYVLVLNVIGLGFGPTISAMIADTFGLTIAQAIAVISIVLMPISGWLFFVAVRRVRQVESYL